MPEPIDHAAEALRRVLLPLDNAALLASAQVHATLALVEQQRIANLIALGKTEERYWVEPDDETGETGYYATRVRDDVRKGVDL